MFRWFSRWKRRRWLLNLPEGATARERKLAGRVVDLEVDLQKSADQIDRLEHDLSIASRENELLAAIVERDRRRVEAETTRAEMEAAQMLPSNRRKGK